MVTFTIPTVEVLALLAFGFAGAWSGLQLAIAANTHNWRHWWKNLGYSKEGGKSVRRQRGSVTEPIAEAAAAILPGNLQPWTMPRLFFTVRFLLIMLEIGAFWNYFTKVFAVEQGIGTHYDAAHLPTNTLFEWTWILFGLLIVFEAIMPHLFFEFTFHLRLGWLPAAAQTLTFFTGAAVCSLMWYNYWAPGLMGLFLPVLDLYGIYITSHFAHHRSQPAVNKSPIDAAFEALNLSHGFNTFGLAGKDREAASN